MEHLNQNQSGDYEEIDLRELVGVLTKRKAIIIFSTIAVAVIAFVISLLMPKIYRARMILEVGNASADVPVESVLQVKDKIDRGFYVTDIPEKELLAYSVKTANTPGSNIVTITADSPDGQKAVGFLTRTGQAIVADHNKLNATRRQAIESQVEVSKTNIKNLRTVLLNPGIDCARERYTAVNEMENRVIDLELEKTQISGTAIIAGPLVSDDPVKPRVVINTVVGAVLGLFFGVFTVLFINWWKGSANKK